MYINSACQCNVIHERYISLIMNSRSIKLVINQYIQKSRAFKNATISLYLYKLLMSLPFPLCCRNRCPAWNTIYIMVEAFLLTIMI